MATWLMAESKYPAHTTREPTSTSHRPTTGRCAMAAVTSTASLCPSAGFPSSSSALRLRARRRTTTVCQCRPARVEGVRRRDAVVSILLSGATALPMMLVPANASAEGTTVAAETAPELAPADASVKATAESQPEFSTYQDEVNKFQIEIPQGWQVGAGEASGIKSVTAFYPEQAADSNVSVVITGIGPDFTSLKSFGDVDAFAENLVNGLDRSWQRPPGLAAKLIDSKAANGLYYVEYTLQNPGERRRHIVSAIGMAFNGWYNRLYTVTGQYIDDDEAGKYRPQIEKVVKSFRLT